MKKTEEDQRKNIEDLSKKIISTHQIEFFRNYVQLSKFFHDGKFISLPFGLRCSAYFFQMLTSWSTVYISRVLNLKSLVYLDDFAFGEAAQVLTLSRTLAGRLELTLAHSRRRAHGRQTTLVHHHYYPRITQQGPR